ncbi:MAG TPA: hypothetical protein VK517_11445 [Cyclobacteriaceae bacterium]|nr:hypothetical protein [Cyclobacteriaceae bacterium]
MKTLFAKPGVLLLLVKDEQHRFELLIAHWDVPVQAVELEK